MDLTGFVMQIKKNIFKRLQNFSFANTSARRAKNLTACCRISCGVNRLRQAQMPAAIISAALFFAAAVFAQAQTHTSVSLENRVYYILEQAEARGLCKPLSGIKPYSRGAIVSVINEILASGETKKLGGTEREILEDYLKTFSKPEPGLDWMRGSYYNETTIGKTAAIISANIGANLETIFSTGMYNSFKQNYLSGELWLHLFANGDIGTHLSYELSGEGGIFQAPRQYLGKYNTYYKDFIDDVDGEFVNREIDVYSEPLSYFPYTYKKRWDGSVYFLQDLSGFSSWPNTLAGGYNLTQELTASFLENRLIARLGRLPHEWGSASFGSSLVLNQSARPFFGIEAEFSPFSWFSIASMTGALEYYNMDGIKTSSMHFQNLFSTTMLQFKYKNYLFLDVGEAVIYPKRFELGYISPITNSIFYQNNSGDFDNVSMNINLKAQYPGIGNIWFSLFWDEAYWVLNFYELDRTMIAFQGGAVISLPFLSFTSLKISYTMVNPYCYTHNRNYNPWYGDKNMETSYTNNGVCLGYYLPPNSDELLLRFKTMPAKNLALNLQYQMIRHGADFGNSAVDGSNLLSELDPEGREGSKDVLKRFFLHDGAYQWMHIIKAGAEWSPERIPLTFFMEAGTVISYFTDIEQGKANTGKAYPYSIVDTADYPKQTSLIVTLGVKLFP
ncbi:MAG: hypothetical protein Pg6A_10950 [Termitinemataceae bacterium]|nr:MAG: hypothetical protein Pg6A_10950 [Termitinemataceae bacterium]